MVNDWKDVESIGSTVKAIEDSLMRVKNKWSKIKADNLALLSKLGVVNFEKNLVLNVINSFNFGIVVTDVRDNICLINDSLLRLLNRKREDSLGLPLGKVLEHDEILSFISAQEMRNQNNTPEHIETSFPELAPRDIFLVSLTVLNDHEGSFLGKMISIKPITREKAIEEAQNEFIAHIAHELKTPLTSVKSYSEMLIDGDAEDPEIKKEFYNNINEEADRLTILIENLLNISRSQMGGLTLNKGLVKTDWLARDSLAAIETAVQKKHILLEKNLPESFPSLVGDKELLKVAIINFLNNAVKYNPENGKIAFSLRDENGLAIFDIIDTGCGVSKEDLPHIFDKFYRSTDSHIRDQTGSGLGLAIASEIIHLHGGEIEVESEPGKGSHFSIRLPKEEYYIGKQ